jgi:threonine dehydratase
MEDKEKQDLDVPTFKDVAEAAEILKGVANRTPVQTSRSLNKELGVNCFFKCENYQRMGAFKFRGGYNALYHLATSEGGKRPVVTYSSGNHAQAVALSASLLNMEATIIMPLDAPKNKVAATKGYGGNVIFYDRYKEDRVAIAEEKAKAGATIIPPYDHKHVIAGQGTAGKELLEDLSEAGTSLDYLFVCVGGGGLISGCALAAGELAPKCKVIGVEPEAGNDAQRSLETGQIVQIDTPKTIADGAQTPFIGKLPFEIMKKRVEKIITVSDEELIVGMRYFGERMKMIVEPTGCLGFAGLRKLVKSGEIPPGSNCGIIISGGNVDMARYCALLTA